MLAHEKMFPRTKAAPDFAFVFRTRMVFPSTPPRWRLSTSRRRISTTRSASRCSLHALSSPVCKSSQLPSLQALLSFSLCCTSHRAGSWLPTSSSFNARHASSELKHAPSMCSPHSLGQRVVLHLIALPLFMCRVHPHQEACERRKDGLARHWGGDSAQP